MLLLKRKLRSANMSFVLTQQLFLTLVAATIGFVSAIFFSIGNALNTSEKIFKQSTPFYDFSEPVASSLTAQKSQYVVGGLLLVTSFIFQIAAALTHSSNLIDLPLWLNSWPVVILVVFASTFLIASLISTLIYKSTISKVKRLSEELIKQTEADLKKNGRL